MKIFSLNLAAYAISKGFNEFEIKEDEEKKGLYYFVFADDIEQVKSEYKKDTKLREFLEAYKLIRLQVNEHRVKADKEINLEMIKKNDLEIIKTFLKLK